MKSVLITGGTTRIGKAIAERLLQHGYRVLTSSHRQNAGADIVADLSKAEGAAKLFSEATKILSGYPPDALVNNAAIFTGDEETMDAINVASPEKLTTLMSAREAGVGAVVNILDANTYSNHYGETKAKMAEWTKKSAALYAATLRVNAVSPGSVLAPTSVHEKAAERLLDRRATPKDIADAVEFLLEAEAITGVILPVDSGSHLL